MASCQFCKKVIVIIAFLCYNLSIIYIMQFLFDDNRDLVINQNGQAVMTDLDNIQTAIGECRVRLGANKYDDEFGIDYRVIDITKDTPRGKQFLEAEIQRCFNSRGITLQTINIEYKNNKHNIQVTIQGNTFTI